MEPTKKKASAFAPAFVDVQHFRGEPNQSPNPRGLNSRGVTIPDIGSARNLPTITEEPLQHGSDYLQNGGKIDQNGNKSA